MNSLTAFAPPPGCLGAGAAAGRALAQRMKITELPQTVAAFHSLVCSRASFHHTPGTHVSVKTSSGSFTMSRYASISSLLSAHYILEIECFSTLPQSASYHHP